MKLIKCCALLLCALLLPMSLCGCWNYIDIDTQFVALGAIVDMDEQTGEYILFTEVAKSRGGAETELVARVETSRGITIFDAIRNSIKKIGGKLYWGHTLIYIVSETVAKNGISEVMSLLSRQTQMRSDIFILIAEDDSVEKIFHFNDPIHDDISQHIHDLLESYQSSGKYRQTPLYEILNELASQEVSLMLPIIKMVDKDIDQKNKSENDASSKDEGNTEEKNKKSSKESETNNEENDEEKILVPSGCGIFKGDKMVERLDEIQTRSALILKKELIKNYILSTEESEHIPKCSIEVINSKVQITPVYNDNKKPILIQIDLKVEGDVIELQSLVDFIEDKKKKELEKAFENRLEKQLREAIAKTQKNGSDIFGIAGIIHIKDPDLWKSISDIWQDIYKEVEFTIVVHVDITSSSLSMNPIKVGR